MAYTDIDDPTIYFQTKLYTGNGSTNAITFDGDTNMQPDWVWIKSRDSGGRDHALFDSVRGATKRIRSNQNDAEDTASGVDSFDTNGFTLGGSSSIENGSSGTFVSWNWKASGSTASNTDGSITSTVSANTTAGFSILTFTGTGSSATVGHGLGAVPKMILFKKTSGAQGWGVYHAGVGNTGALRLDGTDATDTTSNYFNNTSPTSSVFTVNTNNSVNNSGGTMLAYCFAEKQGYSKIGSYTGNGNADGAFIYLGFKPAWVLLKQTDSAGSWNLYDNKRNGFNVDNDLILTDASNAEANATFIDFLSNGFKIRDTDDDRNASNGTYIFLAFAESPLVNSNGIPNNAR
tara:strand:+ start:973 stop:2013 length:1041 start_codon:yes stop_codon:yes gene_type:complete